jgi:hypothetical protein
MTPGIRTTHLISTCAPCSARDHPTKRLHHPRYRTLVGRRHIPELERHDARSRCFLADHLRSICGAVGVRDCVLGRVEYVEVGQGAESAMKRHAVRLI